MPSEAPQSGNFSMCFSRDQPLHGSDTAIKCSSRAPCFDFGSHKYDVSCIQVLLEGWFDTRQHKKTVGKDYLK